MNYSEKTKPCQKPGHVFLIILVIVILMIILYAAVSPLKYASLMQLAIFVVAGASVYILIRYFMTIHEYSIYDGKLIFSRGEGRKSAALMMLDFYCIELIAPVSYSGIRLPHAARTYTVNACSSLGAKNHTGWCVYARPEGDDLYKVIFEPSEQMLYKLKESFENKYIPKGEE